MNQKMNEKLLKSYNTEIFGSYKKLLELGYISIDKLMLPKAERDYLIRVAKEGRNTLAIGDAKPISILVKKDFYQSLILEDAIKQNSLEIKIQSEDLEFISELVTFLTKKAKGDRCYCIRPLMSPKKLSENEKVNFLSSRISDVAFNTKVMNSLKFLNIQYVFQIVEYGNNLLKLKNFGERSLGEIKREFRNRRLTFDNVPKDLVNIARMRCSD